MSEFKNPKPLAPTGGGQGTSSAVNASAAPSRNTKPVAKKGAQAGDPASMAKPARKNVQGTSGARYGIRVAVGGGVSPEAGETLGNGRLFTSAVNRTLPNFQGGADSSY
jgi:hypothetical protein